MYIAKKRYVVYNKIKIKRKEDVFMSDVYYCPFCGWRRDTNISPSHCLYCNSEIQPVKAKHDLLYYIEEAQRRWGKYAIKRSDEIILEEARQNPLFDKEKYELARKNESDRVLKKITNEQFKANLPKCPTCGSTNIQKISDLRRGVHAVAWGLLSNTARSQFECKNCGYKW